MTNPSEPDPKTPDLLGGDAIARHLFRKFIERLPENEREKAVKRYRRAVYHLVETSRLPVFRLGSQIAARSSALTKYIEDQEKKSASKTVGWEDEHETP